MTHEIKNQDGNHIIDERIRDEIKDMIDKGLDYTYVDKAKVSVIRDFRKDNFRGTIVEVEDANCEQTRNHK